jgi:hypothetical protein
VPPHSSTTPAPPPLDSTGARAAAHRASRQKAPRQTCHPARNVLRQAHDPAAPTETRHQGSSPAVVCCAVCAAVLRGARGRRRRAARRGALGPGALQERDPYDRPDNERCPRGVGVSAAARFCQAWRDGPTSAQRRCFDKHKETKPARTAEGYRGRRLRRPWRLPVAPEQGRRGTGRTRAVPCAPGACERRPWARVTAAVRRHGWKREGDGTTPDEGLGRPVCQFSGGAHTR